MACRVIENEPEISAWDAMIAAAVERPTSGSSAHDGASRKNGCSDRRDRAAARRPGRDSSGSTPAVPARTTRGESALAEVAHVGVQRFAARHDEEHGTEHRETDEAVVGEERHGVARIEGTEHRRQSRRSRRCRAPASVEEPDDHDRTEEAPDPVRPVLLNQEEPDEDRRPSPALRTAETTASRPRDPRPRPAPRSPA